MPLSPAARRKLRIVWELSTNTALALLFLPFALIHGSNFLVNGRIDSLFLATKEMLDVTAYSIRRVPDRLSTSPRAWLFAFGGTAAPLFIQPNPTGLPQYVLGDLLLLVGLALQILAVLSLNRSFGIVPADRGVKTKGLYRFVRHPLYASYAISLTGYLLANITVGNAIAVTAGLTFQVLRIFEEEQLLLLNEDYQKYVARVRWRLFPGVF